MGRAVILFVVVLAASPFTRRGDPIPTPLQRPFDAFPLQLATWRGEEGPSVEPEVVKALGADDVLNRTYVDPGGSAVALWVAFYGSQQQGDAIHSPLNCLPGTGWTPIAHSRPIVDTGNARFAVNRYVVEKRGQQQLVTYWFQGRGRTVASEYANKGFLLLDAVRLGRTDGALVRVVAPIGRDARAADSATARFIASLQPTLSTWLP